MISALEIVGTISSLGGIYFAAQGKRIAWPLQMMGSAVYLPLFLAAHLFAQGLLHVAYIFLALYGFYQWRPLSTNPHQFVVSRLSLTQWITLNTIGIISTFVIGQFQIHFLPTDLPYLDSLILVFGLFAQWMQAAKKIENWPYWIVLNLLSAGIYWYKELTLIVGLYLIYTGIAIHGWHQWSQPQTLK